MNQPFKYQRNFFLLLSCNLTLWESEMIIKAIIAIKMSCFEIVEQVRHLPCACGFDTYLLSYLSSPLKIFHWQKQVDNQEVSFVLVYFGLHLAELMVYSWLCA